VTTRAAAADSPFGGLGGRRRRSLLQPLFEEEPDEPSPSTGNRAIVKREARLAEAEQAPLPGPLRERVPPRRRHARAHRARGPEPQGEAPRAGCVWGALASRCGCDARAPRVSAHRRVRRFTPPPHAPRAAPRLRGQHGGPRGRAGGHAQAGAEGLGDGGGHPQGRGHRGPRRQRRRLAHSPGAGGGWRVCVCVCVCGSPESHDETLASLFRSWLRRSPLRSRSPRSP